MARRFRYYATPDDIKEYLTGLGYKLENLYNVQDKTEVTGFSISGTDVQLDYDIRSRHPITGDLLTLGFGMIGLYSNVHTPEYTLERADRSLKLYERLHRRFSKPPTRAKDE